MSASLGSPATFFLHSSWTLIRSNCSPGVIGFEEEDFTPEVWRRWNPSGMGQAGGCGRELFLTGGGYEELSFMGAGK